MLGTHHVDAHVSGFWRGDPRHIKLEKWLGGSAWRKQVASLWTIHCIDTNWYGDLRSNQFWFLPVVGTLGKQFMCYDVCKLSLHAWTSCTMCPNLWSKPLVITNVPKKDYHTSTTQYLYSGDGSSFNWSDRFPHADIPVSLPTSINLINQDQLMQLSRAEARRMAPKRLRGGKWAIKNDVDSRPRTTAMFSFGVVSSG